MHVATSTFVSVGQTTRSDNGQRRAVAELALACEALLADSELWCSVREPGRTALRVQEDAELALRAAARSGCRRVCLHSAQTARERSPSQSRFRRDVCNGRLATLVVSASASRRTFSWLGWLRRRAADTEPTENTARTWTREVVERHAAGPLGNACLGTLGCKDWEQLLR